MRGTRMHENMTIQRMHVRRPARKGTAPVNTTHRSCDGQGKVLRRLHQRLHGRDDVGEDDGHRGFQVLLAEAQTVQNLQHQRERAAAAAVVNDERTHSGKRPSMQHSHGKKGRKKRGAKKKRASRCARHPGHLRGQPTVVAARTFICLKMVLLPDSPAPGSRGKRSIKKRVSHGQRTRAEPKKNLR
jgi:hypothetical protein